MAKHQAIVAEREQRLERAAAHGFFIAFGPLFTAFGPV